MNDAGLEDGLGSDLADRVGQALQPVAYQHEDVLDAAVLQLGQDAEPGQWMRRQTGHGTKGTREYDWAWRWSLFSLIAAAVLALMATAVHDADEADPALVPLSCPELIRLLRALVLPPPARDRDHVLHWTTWRRRHQAVATACHQQRHHRHDQP
ncbi:hypothetical protein GCM10012286_21660 [Streptomyces lasiicapitis]|uniref:Uncharacterized protein n=2 Tax=Streptomyces lasiicapitis TaxID=1923961 RepID=A0ABQ2LPW8_9ACTN|nr:hypothetical protein GCM10012286_21660 [Streptomyces lasiicapitis]